MTEIRAMWPTGASKYPDQASVGELVALYSLEQTAAGDLWSVAADGPHDQIQYVAPVEAKGRRVGSAFFIAEAGGSLRFNSVSQGTEELDELESTLQLVDVRLGGGPLETKVICTDTWWLLIVRKNGCTQGVFFNLRPAGHVESGQTQTAPPPAGKVLPEAEVLRIVQSQR